MTTLGGAADAGHWTQLRVDVDPERVDLAVDILWSCDARGIEEQTSAMGPILIAGFETEPAATAAATRLRACGLVDLSVAPVVETGLHNWREFAQPVAAGPFWLVPSWTPPPADVEPDKVIRIDPGAVFGSGSHATTRLVIELLAELVQPDDGVIDVGCGSGVLAIAAARLGASSALGIDIDPGCEEVLRANATRNQVDDRVKWDDRTIDGLANAGLSSEVVVANLLAPVIAEYGPALISLVRPGGALVVSGLLADRWEATVGPLAPWQPTSIARHEEWVAVALADPHHRGR